ncbi:MAG: hypothetical protein COU40_01670 [Candidatus Moranbacteria bacterium CG10_big_fil_rev_8_21_14_0_10_35_21]|nr:MAG: hypothetical protein COU40_01670 [Candidatus Moranbacteria bacterium CG10_big_fil_rev_8_21_14_0_10_35_21]PJA88740.1 MAG: hypothetical protein CO139_01445 [Candidatus Moranbacteria bacterium CG_4_9_14_3_um_filter_36_9]
MTIWSKPSGVDTGWNKLAGISSASEAANLVQETGDDLLQETGDNILVELWSGFKKIIGTINTRWQ